MLCLSRRLATSLVAALACCSRTALASPDAEPATDARPEEAASLHFQETTVTQGHPHFHAPYSGGNSLQPASEVHSSITSTLFGGVRAWPGAELYLNPELSGGSGLSQARGVAGFPNGETFRVGSAVPVIYLARLFLRQTFELGGERVRVDPDLDQLGGMHDSRRLTLTAGRFGVADLFDDNTFSHDPRTQFLNWALMSAGAWDYPADTRGYTWGLAADYTIEGVWSLRAAAVLVPKQANGLEMDTQLTQAEGLVAESEWHYSFGPRRGAARALIFLNRARMGSYDQAIAATAGAQPDITGTRRAGRIKGGFAINAEQAVTEDLGAFVRLSWNDGKNETWAFTEIDHSAALGVVQRGTPWLRPGDEFGLALIAQGISTPHRRYLAAGGLGFILGDGALHYGPEGVLEAYYRLALTRLVAFSPDYQFILHPAYNSDRGPVHVLGLRMHVEL